MKKEQKMVWNVYYENFNKREIEIFNVFDHYSFSQDVQKLIKKKLSRTELIDELKTTAMYYFWSRSEYEVVITSFPPYIEAEEVDKLYNEKANEKYKHYRYNVKLDIGQKVDIYQQLNLNWDRFVDYVWSFTKHSI